VALQRQKPTDQIRREQQAAGRLDDAGAFPDVVLIDTVSYCNLRCSMCVHEVMTRKRGVMPWDLYVKIIDEIARERPEARVWLVFFGEALIIKRRSPSIFDMIRYAKDAGLQDVVLNSNACLLDESAAVSLIESGLDGIYVGIDAFTPETYSELRVGGDHGTVVANVQRLLRLKEEMRSPHPDVYVQFVVMDQNEAELDDFVAFWNAQKAKVKIRPKVSWGGLIDAQAMDLGGEERWPCTWAMRSLSITDQGDAVLCPVDLDARCVVGEVRSSSIAAVWGGFLRDVRRAHAEHRWDDLPDLCRACTDWQSARAEYSEA
jgi:sulfatase maturation enzyme AslB (radical SAM superfamily)